MDDQALTKMKEQLIALRQSSEFMCAAMKLQQQHIEELSVTVAEAIKKESQQNEQQEGVRWKM